MRHKQFFLFLIGLQITCFSQVKLTLSECEALFQKNNLLLLAEQYTISSAQAAVIQAKIWDRPYLSGELNLINPKNNTYFDVGNNGQKAVAIQQLIYLGGKKRKEINYTKSNVQLQELEYEQLIRSLKLELQKSFYEIYFIQKKVTGLTIQLNKLEEFVDAYDQQVQKGNIPMVNLVRLNGLILNLRKELLNEQKNNLEQQEKLKLLINSKDKIDAVINETEIDSVLNKQLQIQENQLQEKALANNPEYLSALKNVENSELYFNFQKSLTVPNITVGAAYDQRGGAFINQTNLTFGIPLPLWNSNKGNIKIAENKLSQSKLLLEQKKNEITARVSSEFANFQYQQNQFNKTKQVSDDNLEKVYQGVFQNFQKQNISIIEFTDFMETYTQSKQIVNELKKQIIISKETINYLVNEKIF